jgi:Flp pilus assembly protein TadD
MAVRDAAGRLGSLHRNVDLRWRTIAEDLETTGLALFRGGTAAGGGAQPVVDTVRRDERLIAQVAFSSPQAGTRDPAVVIEVTPEGASAPVVRRPTRVGRLGSGPQRLAQEVVPVSLLPPGRYTVAALVTPAAPRRAREGVADVPALTRTIDVLSELVGESPAGTLVASPSAVPTQLAALALVKPAQFETASVLDPARVAPILERLRGRVGDPVVSDALIRLQSGPWPTDASTGPLAAAPVASHFVTGLGHLQAGDFEVAAAAFRNALHAAPDFLPAMAYLGACYAAGGKDKEAASAWQMALLRDRELDWLQRLAIEAWLRAEKPTAALALIKQARQRSPGEESFARLQVRAQLADGRAREALETLQSLPQPDEASVLIGLATLYTAAKEARPVWDSERDLDAMKHWRQVYASMNGASLSVVDAWLNEISLLP